MSPTPPRLSPLRPFRPLQDRFRFTLHQLLHERGTVEEVQLIEAASQIPGFQLGWRGSRARADRALVSVTTALNCTWMGHRWAQGRAACRVEQVPPRAPMFNPPFGTVGALEAVRGSELARWDEYKPFQREAVLWAVPRGSGHFLHPAGAGKTWSAVAYALAAPGPVVIVTKASVRPHWGRLIQYLTAGRVRPWVSSPRARTRVKWSSPWEYVAQCRALGRRPVVVVAWEELGGLMFGRDEAEPAKIPAIRPDWLSDPVARLGWELDLARRHVESGQLESGRHSAGFFLRTFRPTTVVFDEIDEAKSPKRKEWFVTEDGDWRGLTRRNRAAASAALAYGAPRRLGMTATPLPDRTRDLWAQLDLVEPGAWGRYNQFTKRYALAAPNGDGGLDDRGSVFGMPGAEHLAAELLARMSFVRHVVSEEITRAELPAFRREVLFLQPDALGRPTKGAVKAVATATKTGDATNRAEAELALAASRKRPAVLEQLVEEVRAGSKIVIFTGRIPDVHALVERIATRFKVEPDTLTIEEIERRLTAADRADALVELAGQRMGGGADKVAREAVGPAVWHAYGETPGPEREVRRQAYMAHPGGAVFVAIDAAMGTGVDLQDTDLFIQAMLPWSPRRFIQNEGRGTRFGQRRPVRFRYLVIEGLRREERVVEALLNKLPAVVEVTGSSLAATAVEDLKGLGDEEAVLASLFAKMDNKDFTPDDKDYAP